MNLNFSIFENEKRTKNSRWGDVYCVPQDGGSQDRFRSYVETNKEIYGELKEKLNSTQGCLEKINICVDNAIEEGNHALFAHYLMERIDDEIYNEENPSYLYRKELRGRARKLDDSLKNIKVLKNNHWRDSKSTFEQTNSSEFYNSKNISDRLSGEALDKDDAVQIGLQIGLNSDEVNKWLKCSGKSSLYILDIVDCIGMFYLDYYSRLDKDRKNKDDNYIFSLDKGHKRVDYVKNIINDYIGKINKIYENAEMSEKNIGKVSYSFDIKAKEIDNIGLAYASDVIQFDKTKHTWNIYKIIEDIRKDYEDLDNSITEYFESTLSTEDENLFLDIINNNMSVFIQVKYAYYSKIVSFIGDLESYKKNYLFYANRNEDGSDRDYYSGTELTLVNPKEIDRIMEIQELAELQDYKCYPTGVRKYIKKYKKDGYLSSVEGYYNCVSRIYGINNCLERDYYDYKPSKNDLYNKLRGDGNREGRTLREFSKNDILKLAVSTGHENDVGQLLISGCFWDVDLVNEKDALEYIGKGKNIDLLDLFILYSFSYRNRIIDEWVKNSRDKNPDKLRDDYRKCFPMVALMGMISRDIQFVFGYISKKNNYFEKYYSSFRKASVFRTIASSQMWFDKNIYPSERKER